MLLNREQYERLHILLNHYKNKAYFYGYLSNHKVVSNYWEEHDNIRITDEVLLSLNSPNLSIIEIKLDDNIITGLMSKNPTNVLNQHLHKLLTKFNIEDYFKTEIKPHIKDYEHFGSGNDIYELVMDDGDFYNEVAFELELISGLR